MGKQPRDFDAATNATLDEIINLFKRSRKIGRRFQIVHVYIKKELIEVTTFRGIALGDNQNKIINSAGILIRDNVFGTIEEDGTSKDFTVHSLYYEPVTNRIIHFFNGYDDIGKKIIRVIGDPGVRFREGPARMLRAIRFIGKLDFIMHRDT